MEGNEEAGKTGLLEKLALVKLNGRGGSTRDQNGLEEICMEKFNASLCHLRCTRKQEMLSTKEIVAAYSFGRYETEIAEMQRFTREISSYILRSSFDSFFLHPGNFKVYGNGRNR